MNEFYKSILEESKIPLDSIVDSIERDCKNKVFSTLLNTYKDKVDMINENPFDGVRMLYSEFKETWKVSRLNLLEEFTYTDYVGRKKTIDPDDSINKLINSFENIYLSLRYRISRTISSKDAAQPIFNSELEYDFWRKELSYSLSDMIMSAEEIGIWAYHISGREYAVPIVSSNFLQNQVKKTLAKYGVKNPESAPEDLKKLSTGISNFIVKMIVEKPRLY